ncbi:MAG: Uma2 family endonuclease [Geminicoccaceae bacterium]
MRSEADIDAFLARENAQEQRFELIEGAVRARTGGTANQDLIGVNVAAALGNRLAGSRYRVHGSNLKVRSPSGAVMYPYAFVRCGPMNGAATVVDDPMVVVEVAPLAAEQKRWAYQAIPSLRAILVISADRAAAELFTPEPDGSWRSRLHEGMDAVVATGVLDLELPLSEFYGGADLAA